MEDDCIALSDKLGGRRPIGRCMGFDTVGRATKGHKVQAKYLGALPSTADWMGKSVCCNGCTILRGEDDDRSSLGLGVKPSRAQRLRLECETRQGVSAALPLRSCVVC